MSKGGTSNFDYIFVGPNGEYSCYYGIRDDAEDNCGANGGAGANTKDKQKNAHNKLTERFQLTFWTEWIENNKDDIEPGKFDEVQITDWSGTGLFPGGQFNIDQILSWDIGFRYLEQFMKSNIRNWTKHVFGYDCCGEIGINYWNTKLSGPFFNIPELFKKMCIIEAKKSDDSDDEWKPFNGYRDSLFQYEHIRLSENALTLIKQVWEYVYSQNQ
jgi:hypothetical protein